MNEEKFRKLTKQEILSEFEKMANFHKMDEKTIYSYKTMISCFLTFLEEKGLDYRKGVTNTIMQEFLKNRAFLAGKKELSQRTMKAYIWVVRDIFRELREIGLIDENPMDGVRTSQVLPKKLRGRTAKPLPTVLTREEFQQLISANLPFSEKYHEQRKRVAILLACFCGLRNTEIRELKSENLHLDSDTPYVQLFGKFNKERIVPLPESLSDVLKDFLFFKKEIGVASSEYVLSARTSGEPYTVAGLIKAVRRELSNLGIVKNKMTPHVLRHTYCSELFARGVTPRKIMLLMGHDSLDTTLIYEHVGMYGGKGYVLDGFDEVIDRHGLKNGYGE